MTEVCPIDQRQINETVTRANAFVGVMGTGLFLLVGNIWFIIFLAGDFFIRGFILKERFLSMNFISIP